MIGLIASFHTIIFAFGRQIYSLSRAGYFPSFLSVTHGERKTPHVALIAGAVLGLLVMLIIWFSVGAEAGASIIGGTLLNMAVAGAMLAYFMQGMSYIVLKKKFPDLHRPYNSPFGIAGAVICMVIAAVTLYFQLTDSVFRGAVIGVVDLLCGDDGLFPAHRAPQAHPLAGGGVRAHQGRERVQDVLTIQPGARVLRAPSLSSLKGFLKWTLPRSRMPPMRWNMCAAAISPS